MGRTPLDEETIREIEARHPDIRFDWQQILNGQDDVRDEKDEVRDRRGEDTRGRPNREPRADREARADREPRREPRPTGNADAALPAYAQLGPEGLARLRTRFGQVVSGIQRRVTDPAERKRLLGEAERLNPDRWGTPEDVKAALEQYETIHESLRSVVGGATRRRRGPAEGPADAREQEARQADERPADERPADERRPDERTADDRPVVEGRAGSAEEGEAVEERAAAPEGTDESPDAGPELPADSPPEEPHRSKP